MAGEVVWGVQRADAERLRTQWEAREVGQPEIGGAKGNYQVVPLSDIIINPTSTLQPDFNKSGRFHVSQVQVGPGAAGQLHVR